MAKHKPKANRWASEASQQALLKFGPQIDALNQIQKEAEAAYGVGVSQARGNADALTATIGQAVPQVGAIYDQAGLDQARSAGTVNQDIAGLPGLSPDLRAAIGLEQANAGSRVSTGRAQALTGLAQQKVAARAGGVYGAQKAHDDLVSQLSKIFDQRSSLANQSGTFQALTTQQLQDSATQRADTLASQAAGRSQSERNSVRSSGIDPDTGQPIPGGKLDPKAKHGKVTATGKPLNPAGEHATARQTLATALGMLKELDPGKTDRHHTAPGLVTGAPAVTGQPIYKTVIDPVTKKSKQVRVLNKDGTPKTTGDLPAIPAAGEWATIAADVYYDGHLSRANQKILANNGYSIKQLGLPTYAQWKKTHRPTASNYGGGAGAGSGTL